MPKSIGVVGGLGPAATVYFRQRLIQRAQQQYKAREDWEYPAIVEVTVSDPEFGATAEYSEETYSQLVQAVMKLDDLGADIIAIPCNTAHMEIDDLQQQCGAPIINMLAEAAEMYKRGPQNNLVVLASRTMVNSKMIPLERHFPPDALFYPPGDLQDFVDDAIHWLMGGRTQHYDLDRAYYGTTVHARHQQRLRQDSFRPLIACTELSMGQWKKSLPLDTLDALVFGCLREAYGARVKEGTHADR